MATRNTFALFAYLSGSTKCVELLNCSGSSLLFTILNAAARLCPSLQPTTYTVRKSSDVQIFEIHVNSCCLYQLAQIVSRGGGHI